MSTSSPPHRPGFTHIYKFIKSECNPNFNYRVPIKVLPKSLISPLPVPSALRVHRQSARAVRKQKNKERM